MKERVLGASYPDPGVEALCALRGLVSHQLPGLPSHRCHKHSRGSGLWKTLTGLGKSEEILSLVVSSFAKTGGRVSNYVIIIIKSIIINNYNKKSILSTL